jgi:hypothetical protein
MPACRTGVRMWIYEFHSSIIHKNVKIHSSYFGLFSSNISRVLQYQLGLCMRPMGW